MLLAHLPRQLRPAGRIGQHPAILYSTVEDAGKDTKRADDDSCPATRGQISDPALDSGKPDVADRYGALSRFDVDSPGNF